MAFKIPAFYMDPESVRENNIKMREELARMRVARTERQRAAAEASGQTALYRPRPPVLDQSGYLELPLEKK